MAAVTGGSRTQSERAKIDKHLCFMKIGEALPAFCRERSRTQRSAPPSPDRGARGPNWDGEDVPPGALGNRDSKFIFFSFHNGIVLTEFVALPILARLSR